MAGVSAMFAPHWHVGLNRPRQERGAPAVGFRRPQGATRKRSKVAQTVKFRLTRENRNFRDFQHMVTSVTTISTFSPVGNISYNIFACRGIKPTRNSEFRPLLYSDVWDTPELTND
jgi:hypothetical protein